MKKRLYYVAYRLRKLTRLVFGAFILTAFIYWSKNNLNEGTVYAQETPNLQSTNFVLGLENSL